MDITDVIYLLLSIICFVKNAFRILFLHNQVLGESFVFADEFFLIKSFDPYDFLLSELCFCTVVPNFI